MPESFGISSIFNIEDLVNYKGLDFNHSNPLDDEPSPEPISETPFHHLQIYYLIQQIKLVTSWMMKLSPPKMMRLVDIWFDGKENHLLII